MDFATEEPVEKAQRDAWLRDMTETPFFIHYITESDLRDVCQRYLAMLCREAALLGVPRDKLFAHGAGWKEGELLYDAPVIPGIAKGIHEVLDGGQK